MAPTHAELKETLAVLEAIDYRKTYQQFFYFEPYAKQLAFFALGATKRERLLTAGNQQGKCVSYQTLISHPDGTKSRAGDLYNAGKEFEVVSWDGSKLVRSWVVASIKKPAEPVVRLWMESGGWFECALNHRVLTAFGEYAFVGSLLASVPCLPQTTEEPGRSVRGEGDLHWSRIASGFLARCLFGSRRCDGLLLLASVDDQAGSRPPNDARPHSHACSHWGDLQSTDASTLQSISGRLSSPGARVRALARSWKYLLSDACRLVRSPTHRRPEFLRLAIAAIFALRSGLSALRGLFGSVALLSPFGKSGNRIIAYMPIGSQEVYDFTVPEFHNYLAAGAIHHNTHSGAFEATVHASGLYPSWWVGRRFAKATKGWACGETSLLVRDTLQKKLCGESGVDELFGTGLVPKDKFADKPSLARGVTDAYDTIQVRHVSGGISIIRFKSYEQGRSKFQGETLDWCWCDEECPMEIYQEILARITATKGMVFTTFTSMLGETELTDRFFRSTSADAGMVQMGLKDALHIPESEHASLIAGVLPYQRVARLYGGIMRGEGLVFTTPEENLMESPITQIPPFWVKLWGIDFGIGHPFAAALILWDRDEDVIHVHTTIRMADALSIVHADAIKRIGADVPVAWPRDGTERDSSFWRAAGFHLQKARAAHAARARHLAGRRIEHLRRRQGDGRAHENRPLQGGQSSEGVLRGIPQLSLQGRQDSQGAGRYTLGSAHRDHDETLCPLGAAGRLSGQGQ